jgi:uncharacterized surface protein with fasciclin (FAS1) repeats
MKTSYQSAIDFRPSLSLTLLTGLTLLTLAITSTTTEANSCGMMKKPMANWGMPMYGHAPYAMHKAMPHKHKRGYAIPAKAGSSVLGVAKRMGKFATLLTALEAANMTGLLEGKGPYTLFAPTDAAFKALPAGALQELLADKQKLAALLKYHVVPGYVPAVMVLQSRELKTASGQAMPTATLSVIKADVPARNGTLHIVDKVLLPTG